MENYRLSFLRTNGEFQAYLSFSTLDGTGINERLLSEKEKLQLARYEGTRAKEFLASRLLIKRQADLFYGYKDIGDTEVISGVFGQPMLNLNNRYTGLGVSIAHKGDLVSSVLFDLVHPIGLDIEPILPDKELLFKKFLTAKEIEEEPDHDLKGVYMWTAKEALSKVLGCGMTVPLSLYEIKKYDKTEFGVRGQFTNFYQYRFIGFEVLGHAVCIVYPNHSRIEISKINNG